MNAKSLQCRVQVDAQVILEERFGGGACVITSEKLGSRLSMVARASGYPNGGFGPTSIIIKHLPEFWYGDPTASNVRREFLEEAAAYTFLEELDETFIDRPQLYGHHSAGLLVMEDLGRGDGIIRTNTEIAAQVAIVLARLHRTTCKHGLMYASIRTRMGLSNEIDNRYESELATQRRFDLGSKVLGEWCTTLGVASSSDVATLVEPVYCEVIRSGSFHTLIHNDLANARQCVMRDGEMYLLDFENARWGHALRDVTKTLIGKFERNLETGYMVLMCPGFDSSIFSLYRRELARSGGIDVDDAIWNTALCDAVLFHLVVQLGALLELMERTEVTGQILPNLRTLIRHSEQVLRGIKGHQNMRRILEILDSRIF